MLLLTLEASPCSVNVLAHSIKCLAALKSAIACCSHMNTVLKLVFGGASVDGAHLAMP